MYEKVSFSDALKIWAKIALLSFGGPAGQISVMHRLLVDEKKWISEHRFLNALHYCMLLPGPEAQQLVTYCGWMLHGVKGGLAAGLLFILPGFMSILILSLLYVSFQDMPLIEGLFFGIKAAVLAIVIQAVIKIGRRALKTAPMYVIAISAFIAIFFLNIPFPLIIVIAALAGFAGSRVRPELFAVIKSHETDKRDRDHSPAKPLFTGTLKTILIWLTLWLAPVVALVFLTGYGSVFTHIALFFSKLAVVTFGGAYAVLAYMAQEAVQHYHWLEPGEMLDGLGMAETTPGPLIQVVQFVGFMGAFRDPGIMNPYLAGIFASILATWVTFAPSFLWIFAGAPYIERLQGNKVLRSALSAITAAVTGVIMNLALWFGLHVLFGSVTQREFYGLALHVPDLRSLDIAALVFIALSLVAVFRLKMGMFTTLVIMAVCGILFKVFL